MSKYNVEIKGVQPLIEHSINGMIAANENKAANRKIKSSEYDPASDARIALYHCADGKIGVPSFAILSCMRKAASQLKKKGSGKKTLKDFVFSGLRITPEMIELTPQEYEVHIRAVVIQRSRILRGFPLFKDWSIKFEIENIDEQTWDGGSIREVLSEAGKYNGLLEFRPLYGTFEVVSFIDANTGKEVK
jgi:hypothetical protein